MISKEERRAWGVLGKMPDELKGASHMLIARWKELAKRADEVSKMRWNENTIRKAKRIEMDYNSLVETAKAEKKKREQI